MKSHYQTLRKNHYSHKARITEDVVIRDANLLPMAGAAGLLQRPGNGNQASPLHAVRRGDITLRNNVLEIIQICLAHISAH